MIDAQPLRIETTRRVVLNPMFKKPGGARFSIYMGKASRGGSPEGSSEEGSGHASVAWTS